MLRTGDILLAKFPYSNQSGSKRRPVVLLYKFKEDLLVAYFTREVEKYGNEPTSILISQEDIGEGRIKSASVIRMHKLAIIKAGLCQWVARLGINKIDEILRKLACIPTRTHFESIHKSEMSFVPDKSPVPVSGRVYGPEEIQNLVDSALDFWLTTGRFNGAFEKRFAEYLGVKHVLTTNSGSSANLLALSALTSPKLGDRSLKPGDEVITVAPGFPTTVNPIVQNQLVPVFVDVDIPTYNIKSELIEKAVSKKTRAIMLAHTLGNPFDINEVLRVAGKYDLWVIEDCCDALGSMYELGDSSLLLALSHDSTSKSQQSTGKKCGGFGHVSTFSFYPAHHITMGEGGAVATDDPMLKKILASFRDWGRDCWCPPGHDNTCKKRFDWKLGDLPKGYDHKYIYSHLGYNLNITDMQASIGLAQMERLEEFIEIRKRNFDLLKKGLKGIEDIFILPEATSKSIPSWFGFPITIRERARINREELLQHLNDKKIGTRLLFGGNLTRQPYMKDKKYRIAGKMAYTDTIMNHTFWIGVYPGLSENHISYVIDTFNQFASRFISQGGKS